MDLHEPKEAIELDAWEAGDGELHASRAIIAETLAWRLVKPELWDLRSSIVEN